MPGPLDEGDRLDYSLSVSEGGEFWAKLGVSIHVRKDENAIQAADRAEKFVDAMLQMHVQALHDQLRPK